MQCVTDLADKGAQSLKSSMLPTVGLLLFTVLHLQLAKEEFRSGQWSWQLRVGPGFLEPCWARAKCRDQLQSLMIPLWLCRVCLVMLYYGCDLAMDPHQPASLSRSCDGHLGAGFPKLTRPMVIRVDRPPKAPHTL